MQSACSACAPPSQPIWKRDCTSVHPGGTVQAYADINPTRSHTRASLGSQGAVSLGGVPLALTVVSFLVPIMEELAFRGCLLGGLSRHLSFGWANLLQAVVFASLHKDGAHFFYLIAIGATAGWLAKKTKGLAIPMRLHGINNAIFVYAITG
jgi:uncharacterized protein